MITLRHNPNEPDRYIRSERGGGKLPDVAQESSPRLISSTPADNSGAVSTSPTIRLTFDSPVELGSGSFFISDGATQSFIDPATGMPDVRIVGAKHLMEVSASSAIVGGGGYYVEFTPPDTLHGGLNYFVFFKPGPIVGASNGLPYAGLSDSTKLNFVTSSDTSGPSALAAKTTNVPGAYNAGDIITINVTFSEPVNVIGTPRLELNVGVGKYATLSGPSSGTSLAFSYTVQAGDTAAELGFNDLNDLASGIVDGSGNPLTLANIAFSALDASNSNGNGSDLLIDTSAPTTSAWNVTQGATDVPHGSTLSLSFSENIVATSPDSTVFVSLDGAAAVALDFTYPSISISGNTLYMSGLAANTSYQVTLSPGAVSDMAGNMVSGSPQIFFATSATGPAFDTIAPGVLDVTADTGAGPVTLGEGDPVRFIVTMSEHLQYIGNVMLNLQIGADVVPVLATGYSGSELYFDWDVEPGLQGANIEAVSLSFDDAYLRDLAGNNAVLTLPNAGGPGSLSYNTTIEIDTAPIMTAADPQDGEGYLPVGANLSFTFSEAVFFGTGGAAAVKLYNSTGIPALVPASVSIVGNVVTIDPSADLTANETYFVTIDADALVDDGGQAYEGTGVEGDINFDTIVDATPPSALEAHTTNSAGAYTTGQAISIVISFDETVTVTGTPQLTLNASGSSYATHTGPTTGSTLEFLYTIEAGDNAAELDFSDMASLASGITDLAGNPLDLAHISFSALDSSGTPGNGSDIVIDTAAPEAQTFSPLDNALAVPVDADLTITFSENIVLGNASGVRLYRIDGSPVQVGVNASVSGNTLTINPDSNLTGGADYYVEIDSGAITDALGNGYVGIVGSTDYNFTAGPVA